MTLRRLRGERGAELVEFALTFPLLLLVILGIIDFGFLFQRYEVLTNAAREGARIAALPGYSAADVSTRVNQFLAPSGITGAKTEPLPLEAIPIASGRCVTQAGVRVSYPHSFMFLGPIVALMGGSGFTDKTLTVEVKMRYEGGALSC
jgi:Flp pilus assembly protein TadG